MQAISASAATKTPKWTAFPGGVGGYNRGGGCRRTPDVRISPDREGSAAPQQLDKGDHF
jgi:hypothetical protein